MSTKPRLAVYWAASCGGCEIALVNLHERLLELAELVDFCFCPCLLDGKKQDLLALPDKGIAITLFNGAIRTDENLEMAHLLRQKTECLIAFGACAKGGGIPALSNLHRPLDHLATIYLDNPTIENPALAFPQTETETDVGILHLPAFHAQVRSLAEVVPVDYSIPGCPPEPDRIWEAVQTLLAGEAPPPGSILGVAPATVCEECSRSREEKGPLRFRSVTEFVPDTERCLLEQGVVCLGLATRGGCGGLCPQVNMPCTGCYGPPDGLSDQGCRMIAALGSLLDASELQGLSREALAARLRCTVQDQAGTWYRYSHAESLLPKGGHK